MTSAGPLPESFLFRGGPLDGERHALPTPLPTVRFPVSEPLTASCLTAATNQTLYPSWREETYVARRVWNQTALSLTATDRSAWNWKNPYQGAVNATVTVEYVWAGLQQSQRWGQTAGSSQAWQWNSSSAAPVLSEAERARRLVAFERQQRRRVKAGRRARQLLLRLLTEEQQAEYAASKAFTVLAANGKVFRLRKGKTAELLGGDGVPVAAYCVHLPYGYAPEDTLAALLLTLRTDPAEFERVANITPLVRRTPPSPADELIEARQQARWRAEHIRESRAILRSEGLSEAEIDALQAPPNHRHGLLVAGVAA